jgi:hypothetical protein
MYKTIKQAVKLAHVSILICDAHCTVPELVDNGPKCGCLVVWQCGDELLKLELQAA